MEKGTPFKLKQKLSKEAALKKAARDKKMAMSPARKRKKAENQRIDRAQGTDSDLHHTGSGIKRVSIKNNRGNFGKGTKNEG